MENKRKTRLQIQWTRCSDSSVTDTTELNRTMTENTHVSHGKTNSISASLLFSTWKFCMRQIQSRRTLVQTESLISIMSSLLI